ncbi:MAG: phage tail assembly chaperone [Pseudomonadota bacterium]
MPWAEMMRAALRLGIAPQAFWRLSLREWMWLSEAAPGAGLNRSGLAALMEDHPDSPDTENDDG